MPSSRKPLLAFATHFAPPLLMAGAGIRLLWALAALTVLWIVVFWAQA